MASAPIPFLFANISIPAANKLMKELSVKLGGLRAERYLPATGHLYVMPRFFQAPPPTTS
jgi:hypothetical protein